MDDFATHSGATTEVPTDTAREFASRYPVSIWETLGIAMGAVVLVAIGLVGLGVKALNNAFYPERAEAIARSIINYNIPGGSKGVFGTNLGGARVAVVAGKVPLQGVPTAPSQDLPSIELLVAQIPVSQETEEIERKATSDFFSGFSFSYQSPEAFQGKATHTEQREFCGAMAPVTVHEGILTLPNQTTAVPALKYEVNVDREEDNFIVILVTVGQDSGENAEAVFRSLQCVVRR